MEAGEVPHPLFFSEMVVQATAQHCYERAVTLVDTMALAPFQVSERQWTDLFESNGDRISKDSLVKLLDALGNCEVASEATVLNLLRSLHSLCGSGTSGAVSSSLLSRSETSEKPSMDGCNRGFDGYPRANMPNYSGNMMDENPNLGGDPLVKDSDVKLDILSVNHASTNREVDADSVTISSSPNQGSGTDGETNIVTTGEGFADDVESSTHHLANKLATFVLNGNSNDLDEMELEMPTNGVDSRGSDIPTAYEILETWKESRKKDGILFPFQLGQR